MLLLITISGLFVKAGKEIYELSKFYLTYCGDLTDSSSSLISLNTFVSYVRLPVLILFFDNYSDFLEIDLFGRAFSDDGVISSSPTLGIMLLY